MIQHDIGFSDLPQGLAFVTSARAVSCRTGPQAFRMRRHRQSIDRLEASRY